MGRVGTSIAICMAGLAGSAPALGCGPRSAGVMSWTDYDPGDHVAPYVIEISTDDGRFLYIGSRHTNDPASVDVALIEALWQQLRPTVAFNEGGDPPTESTREEAVRLHGEPGLVRYLAARDGVPVASLDPTTAELVAALQPEFTGQQLKLFFVLQQVMHHRSNPTEPFEARMGRVFAILNRTRGLDVPPRSVDELDEIFRDRFSTPESYRDVPASWFDPTQAGNFLQEIARRASEVRDAYMVDLLVAKVRAGGRVLAVVGASHVVMQEPAIRSRLR